MTQVMVDMSVTLLHHGHVRLLKKAKEIGIVVVSLATDEQLIKYKKIVPLLNYEERKEILSAIRYVDKIVSCPMYYINDNFLKKHKCDFLVHGDDNQNFVSKNKLIIFSRTEGISSTKLRNEKNF